MDIASGDIPSDDLQTAIKDAQADLATACASPVLRREPIRLVLACLSSVLGVFGRTTTQWERAVADVIAARNPMSDDDRAALKADLVEAVENGAFWGMRKEAQRMIRTFDRRLAAMFGISVGAAFVVGGLAAWALIVFTHWGPYGHDAQSLAAWHELMQNNPDPRPAIAAAEIKADQTGRRYYAGLALWLDPTRPPGQR
jgi:hypothetical protein